MHWRMRELMHALSEYQDDLRRNELDYSRGLISLDIYKRNRRRFNEKVKALTEKINELSGKG